MSTAHRLAYADPAAPAELYDDCARTARALHLPDRESALDRAARLAARPAPSLRYDASAEAGKHAIPVGLAAARIAAAVYDD